MGLCLDIRGFKITCNFCFRYDGGRITKNGIRETDCGIKISDLKDADHGRWECSISAVNEVRANIDYL